VPVEQIEAFLKGSSEAKHLKPAERKLAAQLAGGSPGAALSMDLAESARLRRSVLDLLQRAVTEEKYSDVFAATAQLAKQENESFENILSLFYSLLTDVLESSEGSKSRLLRNPDLRGEVESLSKKIDWQWVVRATQGLDTLEAGLRRNISRQLGLDALVTSLSTR